MNKQKLDVKENSSNSKLAILMLGNSVLHLAVLFIAFVIGLNQVRIANKPVPSLVMLDDGQAINTTAVDRYYRKPQVVRKFVNDIMTSLFTWDGYYPAETPQDVRNPVRDSGVKITNRKTNKTNLISTSTYEATAGFDPELREEFLEHISSVFPQSIFKTNKQAHLIVKMIGDPMPIEGQKNAYTIKFISNLVVFENGNTIGEAIPINRLIYVRAVEIPALEQKETNPFKRQIAKYRQAGLEIFDMEEFEVSNLHSS